MTTNLHKILAAAVERILIPNIPTKSSVNQIFFASRDVTVTSWNVLWQEASSSQLVPSAAATIPCFKSELYLIQ